jgi:hypothetical protein
MDVQCRNLERQQAHHCDIYIYIYIYIYETLFIVIIIIIIYLFFPYGMWVPVNKALRVLRLRMEERPAIWRVVADIFNRKSWIADKGWSFSFKFQVPLLLLSFIITYYVSWGDYTPVFKKFPVYLQF